MNYVALDFKTANANRSSICQIGIAIFKDGELIDTFTNLVDPHDYYDTINVLNAARLRT